MALSEEPYAARELLLLTEDNAEMVQRLEVIGLASQDVFIEFLRLRELSPLVQGKPSAKLLASASTSFIPGGQRLGIVVCSSRGRFTEADGD